MNVLAHMNAGKHEQVVFAQDLKAGRRAIIGDPQRRHRGGDSTLLKRSC
jgi:hypothetical protein